MQFIDIHDLKDKTSFIIDSLQKENVVLTKNGKPVALIQKFDESDEHKLSEDALSHIVNSNENIATQYAAMMKVWGDPKCDIYDEAFMDD